MDSEHDEQLDRAISKHVQRAKQEAERQRLNGLASKVRESRQTDFLGDFAERRQSVIAPQMDRVEQKLERARGLCDDAAAARRLASAQVDPDGEDRIELSVSGEGKTHTLTFHADTQRRVVLASSTTGSVNAVLNLDQITDDIVGPIVTAFAEQALRDL